MFNIKQKIYDLKHQQKELSDQMGAMLEKGETGEEYGKLEKQFDELQAQVEKCEKQLAREGQFEGEGGEGADNGIGKAFQGGTQTAKVYEGSLAQLKGIKLESIKSFASAVRKTLVEGTGSKGGYTVPEDIVTRIYKLIEDQASMLDYIRNEPVTTDAGRRTYKTRAQHTGFLTVSEAGKIPKVNGHSFGIVEYVIAKRAGILPVTNELLEDSDENITALVMEWFADEARATVNNNAVALATTGDPVAVSGLDTIIAILTGLGSALRAISTVHTNQSGLLYLQSLKDGVGRPLLQPDPTNPTRMTLGVGAMTVPVKDWPNDVLPNTSAGKIPFVIGSLYEGIFRFDRKALSIASSDVASFDNNGTQVNAFGEDLTLFRGIMRDDYKLRDAAAFVYAVADPSEGKTLESILIAQAPTKTAYTAGETLDLTGLKVLALYTDGTYGDVTNVCTFDPDDGDALATSDTEVTVSCTLGAVTKTATQAITVTEAVG